MTLPSTSGPYLTTDELSALIKYDPRTIRNRLKDSVLLEGVHYIRPFGGRKILFIREAIERDIAGVQETSPEHAANEEGQTDAGIPAREQPPQSKRQSNRPRVNRGSSIPMAGGGVCRV